MIDLRIEDGRLEIEGYRDEATLADLRCAVEEARTDPSLVTAFCAGCGRCCYYEHLPVFGFDIAEMQRRLSADELAQKLSFPGWPSIEDRRRAITDLQRQHGFDRKTASLLYEYNVAEPVSYTKSTGGSCAYLSNGVCSNYAYRAYTCALYACTMGDDLLSLQERIVRQGVWHSYHVLGWVSLEEISHNPFVHADRYDTVRIAAFDVDLSKALESLFFYF